MPKPMTAKDVICALQFGGERLIKTMRGNGKANWQLHPSGSAVPPSAGEEAIRNPECVGSSERGGSAVTFSWRAAE